MKRHSVSLSFHTTSCLPLFGEIAEAMRRRPELRAAIKHFMFDDDGMRPGLYHLVPIDQSPPERTLVSYRMVPAESLRQFAYAISQGVVPHMPLPSVAGGA